MQITKQEDGSVLISPLTLASAELIDAMYDAYKAWEEKNTRYLTAASYKEAQEGVKIKSLFEP